MKTTSLKFACRPALSVAPVAGEARAGELGRVAQTVGRKLDPEAIGHAHAFVRGPFSAAG